MQNANAIESNRAVNNAARSPLLFRDRYRLHFEFRTLNCPTHQQRPHGSHEGEHDSERAHNGRARWQIQLH
jgi:hypothetical protein